MTARAKLFVARSKAITPPAETSNSVDALAPAVSSTASTLIVALWVRSMSPTGTGGTASIAEAPIGVDEYTCQVPSTLENATRYRSAEAIIGTLTSRMLLFHVACVGESSQ